MRIHERGLDVRAAAQECESLWIICPCVERQSDKKERQEKEDRSDGGALYRSYLSQRMQVFIAARWVQPTGLQSMYMCTSSTAQT